MPEGHNVEISHQLSEKDEEEKEDGRRRKERWEVAVEGFPVCKVGRYAASCA